MDLVPRVNAAIARAKAQGIEPAVIILGYLEGVELEKLIKSSALIFESTSGPPTLCGLQIKYAYPWWPFADLSHLEVRAADNT